MFFIPDGKYAFHLSVQTTLLHALTDSKYNFIYMMKKVSLMAVAVVFGMMVFGSAPAMVQANDPLGLAPIGSDVTGLTDQDVRTTAGKVIKVALTLLGTIMLVLVIYAGFLWMTAGGNEDQIGKAKSILSAAVVGIVIILSAYAITDFVISQLAFSTGVQGVADPNAAP